MFNAVSEIYFATRKRHDQLFNTYFMRPLAAVIVSVAAPTRVTPNQLTILNLFIFIAASAALVLRADYVGGLVAIAILELSYIFDCADGMLARHKKIASREGHLFDFFTDESKAILLAGALAARHYRSGGLGLDGALWLAEDPRYLMIGMVGVIVLASAISLTNFVRRPELTGKEGAVAAHYETEGEKKSTSLVGRIAGMVTTFLRFLNHYPSHIWIFALFGRLDLFLYIYIAINGLYLGRGWLGLLIRFGRS